MALEAQERGLVPHAVKRFLIATRYDVEAKVAAMVASRDRSVGRVQDALNEVELMRLMVLLSGEGGLT